jgi:copper chaperone CopZ
MKRTFKIIGLDCANCAAKIESAVNRIDGVNMAAISFMTQRFTLDAADDKFDKAVEESKKVCKRIDPECTIVA